MAADEILEEFSLVKRKARKRHRCEECGGDIDPGSTYQLGRGIMKGEGWQAYRFHKMCWLIREAQAQWLLTEAKLSWSELPGFGEMVEYAHEDAREASDFPPYWPHGVYVSREALRAHVKAWRDGWSPAPAEVV